MCYTVFLVIQLKKKNIFSEKPTFVLLALTATALWGTAFPAVKLGYAWFGIETVGATMLFAGIRFALAGLLVLLFFAFRNKALPLPEKKALPPILLLALVQVAADYYFYYIGLSNTKGGVASIVNSFDAFCIVFLGALFFKSDKLTLKKLLGCVLGIAGIVIVNLDGAAFSFRLTGEGFLLISAVFSTFGIIITKKAAMRIDPLIVTGWYLLIGGGLLALIGLCCGGTIRFTSVKADLILLWLAAVAATAFMIWSTLLKYNPASQVGVFKLMVPVFGSLFSALFLHENIFTFTHLLSVVLVAAGIGIVNYERPPEKKP